MLTVPTFTYTDGSLVIVILTSTDSRHAAKGWQSWGYGETGRTTLDQIAAAERNGWEVQWS